jgi:hypothetical protein
VNATAEGEMTIHTEPTAEDLEGLFAKSCLQMTMKMKTLT